MKSVLIVEDEKMIRQGIRTMVSRSGVPIDVIMECSNGLMALDILKEQEIDVMFTDIRMPKMDGIQLVKEVQKLEHIPQIVAISGYDDFSYAVEMLRNGVREYILKPVERAKITEILTKLDEELKEQEKMNLTDQKIGLAQIKHVLTEEVSQEEIDLFIQKYEGEFFPKGYRICVAGKNFDMEHRSNTMLVKDMKECNLCIFEPAVLGLLEKEELWQMNAGISCEHQGIREIREAFHEAMEARKHAFYLLRPNVYAGDAINKAPEGLIQQERKKIEESAWNQRLHLVGTDRTEELVATWGSMFDSLKKGHIVYSEFENGMLSFLTEFKNLYRNAIEDEDERKLRHLENIYAFSNIEDYEENLMNVILGIHNNINTGTEDSKNQQKMKQALAYIEANYDKDLNMAVVSNEVSMNYSLFSFAFKQFTGSNFVNYLRDIRIAQAKRLLEETDLKVIDISQQIGYDNEKHFMKVFKGVCGVSPTEYRKIVAHKEQ